MRKRNAGTLWVPAMMLIVVASAIGNDKKKDNQEKNKYQTIEVVRFEVQEDVEMPPDYLVTLTEELVTHLQKTKKFTQVLRQDEKPTDSTIPSLKLVGKITEFKAGSRAKRYLVGFGAGKTKIKAHVRYLDRNTGAVVFEDEVDGKVVMGVMGGDSTGATRGLAKEVAEKAKDEFFD